MNRVRRYSNENPLNERFLHKTVKFPLKVMIWACFWYGGVGHFHVCNGNMNSENYLRVLETKLKPTISNFKISQPIHLDDSAPSHRTQKVKNWHAENEVIRLDWPGNSADLNPIENLWSILKYDMKRKMIKNQRELIESFIKAWNRYSDGDLTKKLALSMKKRLRMVIENKRGQINY